MIKFESLNGRKYNIVDFIFSCLPFACIVILFFVAFVFSSIFRLLLNNRIRSNTFGQLTVFTLWCLYRIFGIKKQIINQHYARQYRNQPVIVIANHISTIDVVMHQSDFPNRTYIGHTRISNILSCVQDFISVGPGQPDVMDQAVDKLGLSSSVIMFPSGTRQLNAPFKTGIVFIAYRSKAAILPSTMNTAWAGSMLTDDNNNRTNAKSLDFIMTAIPMFKIFDKTTKTIYLKYHRAVYYLPFMVRVMYNTMFDSCSDQNTQNTSTVSMHNSTEQTHGIMSIELMHIVFDIITDVMHLDNPNDITEKMLDQNTESYQTISHNIIHHDCIDLTSIITIHGTAAYKCSVFVKRLQRCVRDAINMPLKKRTPMKAQHRYFIQSFAKALQSLIEDDPVFRNDIQA